MNPITEMVQACITSVSFPASLDDVREMAEKNTYVGKWRSDMDILLAYDSSWETTWTAPRWMTQNDLLFFYHTKRVHSQFK